MNVRACLVTIFVFCFLKLVFECFENCNKKQYYNRFENKNFVWQLFFTGLE